MSIGTAVLLSSIIICITILYVNAKDSWNWKIFSRIFNRITFKWLAIVVIGFISLSIITLRINDYLNNRSYRMTEYEGVRLGETKDIVQIKLGSPVQKLGDTWFYNLPASPLSLLKQFVINFSKENKVISVIDEMPLYMTRAIVLKKYGFPFVASKAGEFTDNTKKWVYKEDYWLYPKYNVQIYLDKDEVTKFGIYDAINANDFRGFVIIEKHQ